MGHPAKMVSIFGITHIGSGGKDKHMSEESNLSRVYQAIKPSIAAIIVRESPSTRTDADPGDFPQILATAFVVREDGLLLTNKHVGDALSDMAKVGKKSNAVFFYPYGADLIGIPVPIIGQARLRVSAATQLSRYQKEPLDLSLIRVKQRGLAPLELQDDGSTISEGMIVATAGYPLGNQLSQINRCVGPVVQQGIVSQVFPYFGSSPHGFCINVMSFGGASGSPVFDTANGKVFAVLYGGLKMPANFTFCVPVTPIAETINKDLSNIGLKPFEDDVPHFADTIRDATKVADENRPEK